MTPAHTRPPAPNVHTAPALTRRGSGFRTRFGPAALITGASSGIGEQFAREIAALGLDVVLVARREAELSTLARELAARHGISARVLPADLSNPQAITDVLRAVADVDIGLVVCAAGFGTSGPFADSRLEIEQDMLDVNCRALMTLTWHFARRFTAQRRGGIVLMSSLVAFQGVPNAAHYAATKAYVQTLAEGLERELRPSGVRVIACAPGPIHSGFAARANMTMGLAQRPDAVARTTLRALGRRATVRPGWLAKFLGWSLATLPRFGRVRVMQAVMGGMTRRPGAVHASS